MTTEVLQNHFTYTQGQNPHALRARALLKKYPQVRAWMKPYPLSGVYTLLIVALQILIGAALSFYKASWWQILIAAYLVGAFAQHALFVMIHEATHDAISHSKMMNRFWGIICNIGQALPSAMSFRTFHLLHHAHLNEYQGDADLAFYREAKWVGNSTGRKILWFFAFMIIEAIRPEKIKQASVWDRWTVVNILAVLISNILIAYFLGPVALIYLLFSTFFSVGLHPVGARWIQEHYTFQKGQETYSYYGPLNLIAFNIGYHNEHHDLFRIPWIHLPKLKKLAPEFYDSLYAHQSWSKLLWQFLTDKNHTLFNRIVRARSEEEKNQFHSQEQDLELAWKETYKAYIP